MAAHFGITKNGYERNERGETLPGIDTLNRLSKNFDISMDWFLFNKGPMDYKPKSKFAATGKPSQPSLQSVQVDVEDGRDIQGYELRK